MKNLNMEVAQKILSKFGDSAEIEFKDERGDGRHFSLFIVSDEFEGKSRVERSQMVYEVLGDLIRNEYIHALEMKLRTTNEMKSL